MDAARLKAFGPGPGRSFEPLLPGPRSGARVERGRIRHARAHLDRLATSAVAGGHSAAWLGAECGALAAWVATAWRDPLEALRLRLQGGNLWAWLEPLPETPDPYRLRLTPHPMGRPLDHPLAPHKGLTGFWDAAVLKTVQAGGAEDALLVWPDGTLAETAIAAIALEVEGALWLPPLEGRVASLAERLDLPAWAGRRTLRTQPFGAADLARGRLWCFNAVRGVWPGTPL